MTRAARAALLSLLASGWAVANLAHAQLPASLDGRRIVAVRVEGETSGATGADEVGVQVGAAVSRSLLRETTTRLLETGRWADVQIDVSPMEGGVQLIVHLIPRVLIDRVDVSGNDELSDDDVRAAIELGPDGALETTSLPEIAETVAAAYAERGFRRARVRIRLRDTDDPTRKILRVLVDEGEPERLIGFLYERDPPPAAFDLPDALGITEDDVLDRTRLHEGIAEVRQRLRARGWLEARVGEPEIRHGEAGASLVIPLRLGPQYTVRILGSEPVSRETVEQVLEL
ncbi:MAG TPA: hypothetical protein ENK57_01125, partial [Polyangiaceae bacterium]|nr:hypothetical protein [Polyangiaceae bacterium]